MISPLHVQAVAEASTAGILACVADGVVISFAAWILLRVLGRQNSGTRFAVWFSALLAIALLPLTGHFQNQVAAGSHAGSMHSLITISSSWALAIFTLWAGLAAVALLRVALGFIKLRQLRKNCTIIDANSLDPSLRDALRKPNSGRPVEICVSDMLSVPTAIGFFKPAVVLPAWTLKDLSPSELNALLLHELAHLKRWDDWTNLIQKILHAVLFFHPAVWWIESRLSLEREMACDDIVLAHTENPRAYAECLLSVAERSFVRRGLSLAQAAVNRMRHTSRRVSQILDANRPASTRVWKPALAVTAAFSLLGFAAAPNLPQLISFRDKTPLVETAAASSRIEPAPALVHLAKAAMTIQPSAINMLRSSARPAVLQASTTRANVRANYQTNLLSRMKTDSFRNPEARTIQARFPANQPPAFEFGISRPAASEVSRPGMVRVSETLFVITQAPQPGSLQPVRWTVRIWRVSIEQSPAAVDDKLPAKKV